MKLSHWFGRCMRPRGTRWLYDLCGKFFWIHLFCTDKCTIFQMFHCIKSTPEIDHLHFAPFYSTNNYCIFMLLNGIRHLRIFVSTTPLWKRVYLVDCVRWPLPLSLPLPLLLTNKKKMICPPNNFRHDFHNATPVCCTKIIASPILTYLNNNLRPILWSRLSLNLLQITIRFRQICTEWKNKRSPSWLYTLLGRVFAFKLRFISTRHYGPQWMRSMGGLVPMGDSRWR